MDKPTLLKQFRLAGIPRLMKAKLAFARDGTAVVRLPARREFLQSTNVVHGAIITFAADTSAYFTAAAASKRPVTTASFSLNLLRPVKASSGLRSTSVIVKNGRTLVIVRSQVWNDDGDLAAEGLWTHAVV